MPAHKKLPERRQRRNRSDLGVVQPSQLSAPPPKGALVTTKQAWTELMASDLASAFIDTDIPTLHRLYSLIDERERAYRAVRKQGRMIDGSQGQKVIHPLLKQISVFDGEIRQLEDRYGLSPAARLRLGIQFNTYRQSLKEMNDDLNSDADEADPRFQTPSDAGTTGSEVHPDALRSR